MGLEHVQLAAPARTLLESQGKLLLMDEPFSALDGASELQLLRLLLGRCGGDVDKSRPRQTLLFVSHRAEAAELFEWVLRVDGGWIGLHLNVRMMKSAPGKVMLKLLLP